MKKPETTRSKRARGLGKEEGFMEFSIQATDTDPSSRRKEIELRSKYRHYRRFPTKALQLLRGILVPAILLGGGCALNQVEPAPGWEEGKNHKWWREPIPDYPDPVQTVQGRSLSMRPYGEGTKFVLILGGIHGSEPGGVDLVQDLEDWIREKGTPKGLTLLFVNPANPDGLAKGKRENAHGIDLNRNFPASNFRPHPKSGRQPLSEPESRFLAGIIKQFHPVFILTVHQPRRSVNWDGPAEGLARLLASYNHYRLEASVGYPTPGSLGSWAGIDLQIPIITLELPKKPESPGGDFAENMEGILQVLRRLAYENP